MYGQERDDALDHFDDLPKDMSLTDLYALLSEAKRAKLRDMIENPTVRISAEGGRDFLNDPARNLLRRLEQEVYVGPPEETQIKRAVGTKVFNASK